MPRSPLTYGRCGNGANWFQRECIVCKVFVKGSEFFEITVSFSVDRDREFFPVNAILSRGFERAQRRRIHLVIGEKVRTARCGGASLAMRSRMDIEEVICSFMWVTNPKNAAASCRGEEFDLPRHVRNSGMSLRTQELDGSAGWPWRR
jgi:hypothetical protein